MKKIASLLLAGALALSLAACGGDTTSNVSGTTTPSGSNTPSDDANSSQETSVPNNGEWDEILCSGDGYHLVKKEVDAYDGYKFTLGVVDDEGQWVQEMTDTGTFVDEVRFRAEGTSETLRDSSCYMYLGEGVFLASPGVSLYTKDGEYRVGPWKNSVSYSPTGRADVAIWECLLWNVETNMQTEIDASKMSTFQDGYLLFCEEDEFGSGTLDAMNTNGEITELPCKCNDNFTLYSEGLFFAYSEHSQPGFYDISGNRVIDLSDYDMRSISYPDDLGINAPYFENGQATILFTNNTDSIFQATIDKTGAFVGEPEKVGESIF